MGLKKQKKNIPDDNLNLNNNVVKPPESILKLSFWLAVIGVGVLLALLLPGIDEGKIFLFTLTGVSCIVVAVVCLLLYLNYRIEYDVDGITYTYMFGKNKKYFYDEIDYVSSTTAGDTTTVSIKLKNNKKIHFPLTYENANEFYEYLKIKNKF